MPPGAAHPQAETHDETPAEAVVSTAERDYWLDLGYADDPDDWPHVSPKGYYEPHGHELAELEREHPYDADDPDGSHSWWLSRLPEHLARDYWRMRVLVGLSIRTREQRSPVRIVNRTRRRSRARATRRTRFAGASRASPSSGSPGGSTLRVGPGSWRPRELAEPPRDVSAPTMRGSA